MNKVELLKMLEEKLGKEIKYDSDLGVLSQAIHDELGETVSHNTLRRMFKEDVIRKHRSSTNDVLAHYLGYKNYDLLLKDCGADADISIFTPVDSIDVENLQQGTQIQFTWDPNRLILASYMGNLKFIVNESSGSKNLVKGDILEISQLAVGFELYVVNVERNGENLGAYHAAKQGGLTSIEIIG